MTKTCVSLARPMAVLLAVAAFGLLASPAQSASAGKGKEVYNTYCLICHGANMVNTGARAYDLRKFPLNAKSRFVTVVKKGKRQMPAWGDVLTGEQVEDLWAYVKTRGK